MTTVRSTTHRASRTGLISTALAQLASVVGIGTQRDKQQHARLSIANAKVDGSRDMTKGTQRIHRTDSLIATGFARIANTARAIVDEISGAINRQQHDDSTQANHSFGRFANAAG